MLEGTVVTVGGPSVRSSILTIVTATPAHPIPVTRPTRTRTRRAVTLSLAKAVISSLPNELRARGTQCACTLQRALRMPIDTSTKSRKVLKWCLACLDKFVNPFDSPCLPLASWLELPAQCKARNVVGGAEGERLDSERWRVPGALARKHAGVD